MLYETECWAIKNQHGSKVSVEYMRMLEREIDSVGVAVIV